MRPILSILALMALCLPAAAQTRQSHCVAIAQSAPGLHFVQQANWTEPLSDYTVRISYIDHAMFLIQAPDGTSAVTDYNGFLGSADVVPDIVTMNHAHGTHWTPRPDSRITHVLQGWGDGATPTRHSVEVGEMFVRNVPTDIRGRYGAPAESFGNSIFVFEVAGLCIGHLGHLHHEPDAAQYAALGRLDVVMAAVDGGLTVDLATMIDILTRLESSVVIPMHWFGQGSLSRFLDGISDTFAVEVRPDPYLEVSLRDLPDRPTVMVLPPAFLTE